jgi:hypothetical protein
LSALFVVRRVFFFTFLVFSLPLPAMDFIFHRHSGARVSDKLSFKDLTLVVIENDAIRVVIVPEKGADIVSFVDKKSGIDVMLRLPTGMPGLQERNGIDGSPDILFSYYEGGWQELFPLGRTSASITVPIIQRTAKHRSWGDQHPRRFG